MRRVIALALAVIVGFGGCVVVEGEKHGPNGTIKYHGWVPAEYLATDPTVVGANATSRASWYKCSRCYRWVDRYHRCY